MSTQSEETWPVTLQRHYPAAPLVGVAAVVFNEEGQALLVKRGRPPRQGAWGLPGGLLDLGERLVDGVRREVREECGVEIDVRDLVAAFEPIQRDEDGRVEYHYVVLDYWATLVSGDAVAQDDADAVAWAGPGEWADYELPADTLKVVQEAYGYWEAFMLSLDVKE